MIINPYIFSVSTPSLIDAVGVSASAAYGLRKLRAAYSGSGVKVRRASDNGEQDIGFSGNNLDWAAAIAFKGASSIYVKTWYDQSGQANHLTQSTTANQASLNTTGEELVFDGSNDCYQVTLDLSATNKVSCFAVAKTVTNAAYPMLFEHNAGATNVPGFAAYTMTDGALVVQDVGSDFANSDTIASFTNGVRRVITLIIDRSLTGGDIAKGRVDGVAMSSSATSTTAGNFISSTLNVGARTASTLFFTGSLDELTIFPSALSDTNRDAGELDINNYY